MPDDTLNVNEIISGLLVDVAERVAERVLRLGPARSQQDSVQSSIRDAVATIPVVEFTDAVNPDALANFLASPDVACLVARLLAFCLVPMLTEAELTVQSQRDWRKDGDKRNVKAHEELESQRRNPDGQPVISFEARERGLRRECSRLTELWLASESTPEMAEQILTALNHAAEAAKKALLRLDLSHPKIQSELRRWLNSIEPRLQLLSAMSSLEPALRYENNLRVQALERHKWLRAPHLARERLQLAANYIEPRFTQLRSTDGPEHVAASELTAGIDRTVVIGSPGAGKSSFAGSVCFTVASQYEARIVGGRLLTPLMVPLRDTVSDFDDSPIIDILERISGTHYQAYPPAEALEYLLSQGRLLVVFDGLDEVSDVADRQNVRDALESFCNAYPMTPVLVTARDIGYEHAELSDSSFRTYLLEEFGDSQIQDYAERWFATDDDLRPHQRKETATAFLVESEEHASDLRHNPLLLALLCGIYTGPGTLPTSRPAIYRACIDLLLRRWDAMRRLEVKDPLEQHLERTLREIASWLYNEPEFAQGMPEVLLVQRCGRYLAEIRTNDEEEAREAAQSFVDFCRDRAWVLVKTGYDREGNSLFGFAHRTFLEYFAAQRLEKRCQTAAELATTLGPLINDRASVVPHLALQLADDARDDAGDAVLTGLLGDAEEIDYDPHARLRLLTFVVDALRYLVPRPSTTRRVARETALGLLAPFIRDTTNYTGAAESSPWPTVVHHLGAIATPNIKAAAYGFKEGLRHAPKSDDARDVLDRLLAGVAPQPRYVVDEWRAAMPELFDR